MGLMIMHANYRLNSFIFVGKQGPATAPKPGRGPQQGDRSVDSLLDQLENSVPSPGPHGGYPMPV